MIGPGEDGDFNPGKHSQQYDQPYDLKFGINLATIVMYAYTATIIAFTRKGFGKRYLSFISVAFLPVCLLFGSASDLDFAVMVIFATTSLFLMGWHARAAWRKKGLAMVHSRYAGYPRICDSLGISEDFAKSSLEPVMVFAVGAMLFLIGLKGLGTYLAIGSAMMVASHSSGQYMRRQQAMDIRDAEPYSESLDYDIERN